MGRSGGSCADSEPRTLRERLGTEDGNGGGGNWSVMRHYATVVGGNSSGTTG
jgi:hypothetical protein